MPDWRDVVRRHVRSARLDPADEADVIEELAQHLEDRHAERIASGAGEGEATAAVMDELRGGRPLGWALEAVRRGARRPEPDGLAAGSRFGGGFWRHLRQAVRTLRRSPAYTLTAVLTLGLGSGAATAVFTLLQAVVVAPLPYAEPQRLVMLWEQNAAEGLDHERLSPVNLLDYRRLDQVFTDVAGWWKPEVNLVDDAGQPIQVPTVEVSENLFDLLGVGPALGRAFPRDDTLHGDAPEVVVSHRLWRTRYGGDPGILGHSLSLNGYPYTIVGVMPAGFQFPDGTDVWQRLSWDLAHHSRAAHFMGSVGRLRPGVTVDDADRELAALGRRLEAEAPKTNTGWRARAVPLSREVAGVFRPGLLALFGASGAMLLIACINVASLALARAAARRGEVSVRLALGADRARLMGQFFVESGVVAALGAALGLGLAVAGVHGLIAWSPVPIPRADEVRLDAAVLGFAVGAAVLTALLFGSAPALFASRTAVSEALEDAGRRGTGGRYARRLRSALVVAEVALSVVLLAGAGVLIRSVSSMLDVDTGVRSTDAVTIDFQLPDASYDWVSAGRYYERLLSALRDEPGVEAASAASFLPVDAAWRVPISVPGAPRPPDGEEIQAQIHSVDPEWFEVLGVPLRGGRGFDDGDRADAPAVVVINQALARRAWAGRDPVGHTLVTTVRNIGPLGARIVEGDEHRVVGVVADVRNTSLDEPAEPAVYFPLSQFPYLKMHLVLRGRAPAEALVDDVRRQALRLDPGLALGRIDRLEHAMRAAADPFRLVSILMSVFAAVSLCLVVIGIYGLVAYSLAQRRREIGVRMALGARRGDILGLVLRQGLSLSLPGIVLGVAATLALGRLLADLLLDVRPADPWSLAAACGLVLAVGLAASLVPGWRAAAEDPVATLRAE